MKVWLLEIGESLPVDQNRGLRLRRIGMLAKALADSGHEVTWWASTFDHYQKRHIMHNKEIVTPYPGLTIRAIRGCGYVRNRSLRRFLDYSIIALKFRWYCRCVEAPDIIFSSFPSIGLSVFSVQYAKKLAIPVILDVRDMWPDIFLDLSPRGLRLLFRWALWPVSNISKWAYANATAITSMTDAFLDWALTQGKRTRTRFDRAFPFGYSTEAPSGSSLLEAERFWDSRSVTVGDAQRTVCYFGSIGHNLDLTTIFRAAQKLKEMRKSIKIVLCGVGDRLNFFRKQAEELGNVFVLGWVGAAEIHVLMARSFAGLDPLPDRWDFLASINNKAIEYLSAGLPVISSPTRGVLSDLLQTSNAGVSYECGDYSRLAGILVELSENPEKCREMANNACYLFQEQFTAEKVYKDLGSHIEMIASMREQGRSLNTA